jgi:hypothetical protein
VGAYGEDSNAIGVNGNQANNSSEHSGAAYVFVRNGNNWSQQAYIKASNTEANDLFGQFVALAADTLVVGADDESSNATGVNGDQTNNSADNAGAVYAFVRNGNTWSQQAYIKASNTEAGDSFGANFAIYGNTIVVGASSEDSNATGVNGDQNNNTTQDSGAAYVFSALDVINPVVSAFTAPALSTSLNIPITGLTAWDNAAVTGYNITESSTPPAAGDSGWSESAPVLYHVQGNGSYSLYPWVKDGSGNVSPVFDQPAFVTVNTAAAPTPTLTPTLTPTHTPVVQTLTSIPVQDGWILESSETSGVGGTLNNTANLLNLGDNAAKKQYRGILSFNTSSIPDNATITAVTLKLKQQGITGSGNPLTIFQGFMIDLKQGFFGTAAALQISDFQAAPSKTIGPVSPSLASNTYTINLINGKTFINKLATSGGLTQIRLRFKLDDNNNNTANYLSLFSGNAAASNHPQLVITYYVP